MTGLDASMVRGYTFYIGLPTILASEPFNLQPLPNYNYLYQKKVIRPATYDDLEFINEIYNLAIQSGISTADTEAITMKERKRWFKKHKPDQYPVFVAEQDGRVVGWISISAYRPGRKALRFTKEVSYYIHPEYQQKGMGSALMEFIIKNASQYDAKILLAMLLQQNTASIKLLKKYGFKGFIVKPYNIEKLNEILNTVLNK